MTLFTQMDDRRGSGERARSPRAVRPVVPVVGDDAVRERRSRTTSSRHSARFAWRARSVGVPARRFCGSFSPTASSGAASTTARFRSCREALARGRGDRASAVDVRGRCACSARCRSTCSRLTWRASTSRRRTGSRSGSARGCGSGGRLRRSPSHVPARRASRKPSRCWIARRGLTAIETLGDGESGPGRATLTLGERHLWLARAEIALIEQRPETALQIVDARLGVGACDESGQPAWCSAAVARPRARRSRRSRGTTKRSVRWKRPERKRRSRVRVRTLWRIEAAFGHCTACSGSVSRHAGRSTRRARWPSSWRRRFRTSDLRARFRAELDALIPSVPAPSAGRAAKEALGGLTQRERDVAELVAQGKANRVIARDWGSASEPSRGTSPARLASSDSRRERSLRRGRSRRG